MKSLRAGCDDGMNMISHGQAASNGYSKNFKRGRTRDTMGVPFPINGDFRRKLQIFPTPCALTPRRKFSWNSVTAIALQETRVMQ